MASRHVLGAEAALQRGVGEIGRMQRGYAFAVRSVTPRTVLLEQNCGRFTGPRPDLLNRLGRHINLVAFSVPFQNQRGVGAARKGDAQGFCGIGGIVPSPRPTVPLRRRT